jgi:hypothetical protein
MQHFNFACYLANLTHSKLTGVFLENLEREVRSRETLQQLAVASAEPGTSIRETKENYCEQHIREFRDGCELRSRLSRFFHRSDADNILRTTEIPVFITHP